MAKLADRHVKLEYVSRDGGTIDGGWGLGDDDFEALTERITRRPRLPPTTYRLDVAVLVHDVRQASRMPLTTSQLLMASSALEDWTKFSNDVLSSVDEAVRSVDSVIAGMGSQRAASIGVSGRVLWGICSLTIPPPVGVALGAIAYAAIEDTWTDGLARLTEWTLQMPMLFDANDDIVGPTHAIDIAPATRHAFLGR